MSRPGEDERLREFFRRVHADDRVPSFAEIARPGAERPAPSRRPALAAAAAVLVAALALVWWVPRAADRATDLTDEEQLALAVELSAFEGPLDFLLDTPGREVVYQPPRLGASAFEMPLPAAGEENPL